MIKPIIFLALTTVPVFAQTTPITRHEVSFGVDASTNTPFGGTPIAMYENYRRLGYLGPQVRYTFNLNRNVAVETSLADSVNGLPITVREGGHQLLALAGVKAGIRQGRFGFFGTSAAGVASFSRAEGVTYLPTGVTTYNHVTNFALRQGVAVEFSPSPRNFIRVDAAELLDAQFVRVFERGANFSLQSFSGVPDHASLTVSYGHRFGHLQELAPEPEYRPDRGYSMGGLFAMGVQEHLLESEVRAQGGGGAWFGFPLGPAPLRRFLSADLVAYDQPHDDHTANAQDGGTDFSAFLGPKLGFRKGPIGLFAKARPGIVRFSRTDVFELITSRNFYSGLHPKIDFALDTGLVLEYAPPTRAFRHALVRFEGGSVYTHYHGATLTFEDALRFQPVMVTAYYYPPQRRSSLVFLAGAGYRF